MPYFFNPIEAEIEKILWKNQNGLREKSIHNITDSSKSVESSKEFVQKTSR